MEVIVSTSGNSQILEGDRLLEVANENISGLSLDEVNSLIEAIPPGQDAGFRFSHSRSGSQEPRISVSGVAPFCGMSPILFLSQCQYQCLS